MDLFGSFVESIRPTYDDTSINRLNYFWATGVALLSSGIIGTLQFLGNPIACWTPKEFSAATNKFIQSACFMQPNYLPLVNHSLIPVSDQAWDFNYYTDHDNEAAYYQWAHYILAIQAFCYHLPHLVWGHASRRSGVNVKRLVSVLTDAKNVNHDELKESIAMVAKYLKKTLKFQRKKGSAMWIKFIATSIMYIGFLIVQQAVLLKILGSPLLVPSFMRSIAVGFLKLLIYPCFTICKVTIQEDGITSVFTTQCAIWINTLIGDTWVLFTWANYVILIFNIKDFIQCSTSFIQKKRSEFINDCLDLDHDEINTEDKTKLKKRLSSFVEEINKDGILVLQLMLTNCGNLITTKVVEEMWKQYSSRPDEQTIANGQNAVTDL